MIRAMLGVLCLLLGPLVNAEVVLSAAETTAIHKTIDRNVWKPFKDAFERLDGAGLNALYAEKVLRVTPSGIDTDNQFKQDNKVRFAANIANGDRLALDFWFDSRHTNSTRSYDVGFYRMAITSTSGATQVFYGQFHIVLKKIAGEWKIAQDWDTASIGGSPITADQFNRRAPARF